MKAYYQKIAYATLLIGLPFFFTACEGDDDEGGKQGTETHAVTLTVDAQAMTDTRATEVTETQLKNNEEQADKIHNLWIYVVNPTSAGNIVEAVIEKVFAENAHGTSYEEVVQLTAGAKKLYGFANLTDDMRIAAGIANREGDKAVSLKVGATFPGSIGSATCNNHSREQNYIPMSAVQDIIITNLPAQKHMLPLLRTMCKMTFSVKNETGSDILLAGIVTGGVTPLSAQVYLLPRWDENGRNILPSGTGSEDITWEWPSGNREIEVGKTSSPFTIYLNESQVANDGWFTFQLNTTTKEGVTNEDRLSISNRQSLNRNDHLPVAITLTDYKLRLDVLSYPPIGGYPSVEVPMKDKEYYAHFPGGGPFIITPRLSKYSDGKEVTEGVTWSMKLEGDKDIFDVMPVLKDNEVTGTLKYAPEKGKKALCTLTATVQEPGMTASRMLTYKVYIMNYQ